MAWKGAGWSSSIRVMKSSKSQQNFTSTVRNLSDYLENEYVEEVGPGIVLSSRGNTRKQISFNGDLVAERKYEDMTSRRIEAEIHHEESGKFSYFREHKKRRPPEADNPMQFQETSTTLVQVEGVQRKVDELQVRSSEISRRSCSASGVEVTPDICGESDLTAENQMADESSRSSNNDGCSMLESAAESVSKGPNTEFRSDSSLGFTHCFMERTYGGREVTSVVTSSGGPGQMSSLLLRNDAHKATMKDANYTREGGSKAGQAASHQFGSGSSEAPSSITSFTVPSQLWGRSKQEWLQLGVGSSGQGTPATSNVHSELDAGEEGQPSPLGQDLNEERSSFKRRITTSIGFPVADCEANSNYIFLPERSNASPDDWQLRRVSNGIPTKLEVCPSDVTGNMNPATLRSKPIPSVTRNSDANSEGVEAVEQPDLCIFGRRLVQRGTARQELVLAPLSCSGTAKSENERVVVRIDNAFELSRDRESFQAGAFPDHRGDRFGNASLRGPDFQNRAAGSLSTPMTDVHLRSAPAVAAAGPSMDHDTFQHHRDNPPSSISDLQQRREDLRQVQVGYSWLPPLAADSAPKLIPTANNFQGWISSESASTMKLTGALSPQNARLDNPPNQQATRGLDEWGNLFQKVSPKMLFQSQCRDLSSEGSPVLVESAGHESNVGSQESLMALKRAIENIQKGPQWPIPPESMNLSIASWCLNGNLQGVRGESKLECFAGERVLLESGAAVQSSFAGDHHKNLSEKPPQRRSWQPAGGQTKLQHGNVTALHRPDPETAGKPRSQMLPPGSRRTSHAGLWFVLQSAENQTAEGGLPQISKAYLRIKDGKMPVSAVKKYLVTKLGLTSESEVEIACKGQPVVPSLPLQHVRDSIWFSSLNASNKKNQEQASCGEREESTTSASEQRSRLPAAADASMFSKDILMVLTYRRHPRSLQLSTLVT